MAMIYHVSKSGLDFNSGTWQAPFLTIQKAADLAVAGDRVIVHEGVYREWVRPRNGGSHSGCRITYEAAKGEHVVIKGSERVTGWELVKGSTWRVSLPNDMFRGENPYLQEIGGDWFAYPVENPVHTGCVYLNGKAMYEAATPEQVMTPQIRTVAEHWTWGEREECILEPEYTIFQWCCQVEHENTLIYANFQGADPNQELVEINVRRSCFYPEKTGVNYITVRGFEMAQAATPWTPPTADQPGLIGPNWSKGWIIEDNHIHDSKCSGISLGKEASTGDNECTKYHRKPGYQNQMEAVFRARNIGWSRERIGSHIVRNNIIHDCGQNGIVGHMGCIFSEIYGNEIYNIAVRHEFFGSEIAGIKFHAPIDVQICRNYIHNCTLGTWLDWQVQGTRVSGNVYDQNNRDLMIEVTHGPCLIDNNIFTAEYTFDNVAQGTAWVHNLCCGFMNHYPVLNRATPYHLPHSTEVLGTTFVYGFDDRWYQNIFVGGTQKDRFYGTASYDGAPVSIEEYVQRVKELGVGDLKLFEKVKQPAYINGNVYLNGATVFEREEDCYMDDQNPQVSIERSEDGVYLEITLPEEMFEVDTEVIHTQLLGMTRLTEAYYENPDGSEMVLNKDMVGFGRGIKPVPGPLETLNSGRNRIKVWRFDGKLC